MDSIASTSGVQGQTQARSDKAKNLVKADKANTQAKATDTQL